LILFGWNVLSWRVLPWHGASLSHFKSDEAVFRALAENAPGAGLYVAPSPVDTAEGLAPAPGKPRVFLAYAPRGEATPLKTLAVGLGLCAGAAFLLTLLLRQAEGLGFVGRVLFVEAAALLAGAWVVFPEWNWWAFPVEHAVATAGDLAAGGLLAGVALAWITRP
jgi:hypothetical protein